MAVTEKETKAETRVVAVAGFPYRQASVDALTGQVKVIHKFAVRGETVTLTDPVDIERGDRLGYFGDPPKTPPPLGLDEMGLMTDDQLFDLFADPPAVKDILAAVGKDKELASRVLVAETGSSHEPRASLVEALEKVTGGEG